MLLIHPYKTDFLAFFFFLLYNTVYFECTQRYQKWKSKNSKTSYSKTTIDELDLLKATALIQWNIKGKKLLSLATKLKEKITDAINLKNSISHFWKTKLKKSVKRSKIKSRTKNFRKPKHYWHKIGYYRTSKNLSQVIRDYKAGWKAFFGNWKGGIGKNSNRPVVKKLKMENLWMKINK